MYIYIYVYCKTICNSQCYRCVNVSWGKDLRFSEHLLIYFMKQHSADFDSEPIMFSNRLYLVLSIKLFILLMNIFSISE